MGTAAEVIRSQINPMVLMSLGASELVSSEANEGMPALAFWARILPFNAKGKRLSRPASMGFTSRWKVWAPRTSIEYCSRSTRMVIGSRSEAAPWGGRRFYTNHRYEGDVAGYHSSRTRLPNDQAEGEHHGKSSSLGGNALPACEERHSSGSRGNGSGQGCLAMGL